MISFMQIYSKQNVLCIIMYYLFIFFFYEQDLSSIKDTELDFFL